MTAAGGKIYSIFAWRQRLRARAMLVLLEIFLKIVADTLACWYLLDGYVRIWSTEAIYNTGNADFASKPKQLASMSNHSGTIHTVRFSPNGRYLASGADDKIVCVYTLDSNPPTHSSTFGRS